MTGQRSHGDVFLAEHDQALSDVDQAEHPEFPQDQPTADQRLAHSGPPRSPDQRKWLSQVYEASGLVCKQCLASDKKFRVRAQNLPRSPGFDPRTCQKVQGSNPESAEKSRVRALNLQVSV
ncbi:hypothetical protein ElyMa_003299100 [Elysia marginata]|uniref:Uncharacterized protein n=1 Tax=Elysia marginata TaxID=1093978 RepID=A0AAV4JGS7_9GAST|nr:hypothetical protein ElyMa_003299100 [Elysia marginata]